MRIQTIYQVALCGLVILFISSMISAMAATNTVPKTGLDEINQSITTNDLKPAQCANIHVSNLITGSGAINGTSGNDLILGSSGADVIFGLGGNDCILGGGGNDTLSGGLGTDVCLGGPETDVIDPSCETSS